MRLSRRMGMMVDEESTIRWMKFNATQLMPNTTGTMKFTVYSWGSPISKMASTTYSISGTTFTLKNPVATSVDTLVVGQYIVDISQSSSSATSGTTLYKITNISSSTSNYGTTYTITYQSYTTSGQSFLGDYLGDIYSPDESAYPENGSHTDGYYYVRYYEYSGTISWTKTSSTTFTVPETGVYQVKIIGGGGGGGGGGGSYTLYTNMFQVCGAGGGGGGGGAGYVVTVLLGLTKNIQYSITVGSAGSEGSAGTSKNKASDSSSHTKGSNGGNGGSSSFGGFTAKGGTGGTGGTKGYQASSGSADGGVLNGGEGSSGGGSYVGGSATSSAEKSFTGGSGGSRGSNGTSYGRGGNGGDGGDAYASNAYPETGNVTQPSAGSSGSKGAVIISKVSY